MLDKYRGVLSSFENHKADQSIIIPPEPKITKRRKPKINIFFSGNFNFSPSPLKSRCLGNPVLYIKIEIKIENTDKDGSMQFNELDDSYCVACTIMTRKIKVNA